MTVHSQFYPSSKCFNRKVIRTKRENGHLKGHFSGKEILALMKRIEIAHRKWLGLPALNFFEPPGKWFWPFWDLKPFHEKWVHTFDAPYPYDAVKYRGVRMDPPCWLRVFDATVVRGSNIELWQQGRSKI